MVYNVYVNKADFPGLIDLLFCVVVLHCFDGGFFGLLLATVMPCFSWNTELIPQLNILRGTYNPFSLLI